MVNENGSDPKDSIAQALTISDLPSPDSRWVARRKAQVVHAIRYGGVSREEVLERYGMTERELRLWEDGVEQSGLKGLMVTKAQDLRRGR